MTVFTKIELTFFHFFLQIPYTDFQLTSDRKAYIKEKLAEARPSEK